MKLVDDCVFCNILHPFRREHTTATVVFRDMRGTVIVPLNPVTKGHVLVIPPHHAEFVWELPQVVLANVMRIVSLHAEHVRNVKHLDCNIIQSNGAWATQTVKHVHFHVVPRRRDDGLKLPWSDQEGG